jgi:effector-binding domain-containing protein
MLTEPEVVELPAQPYVAIRARVTMQTIGTVLPELHPQVFAWLAERDIRPGWLDEGDVLPAGLPFWKYNVIDMEREMEVEVAAPVTTAVTGDDQVLAAVLPAGRYATLRHTGHPAELYGATVSLLEWAKQQNLAFDVKQAEDGEHWAARLEIYQTDLDPDMSKWATQLAFRLSDSTACL